MSHFDLETWDHGRLVVNHDFANLLRRHHWTTFAAIWSHTAGAAVAKKLRTDRITLRFTLDDAGHERAFYIKRHVRSAWKEYIKPLLSLRWPILGARNEWNALLEFHRAGLPTMVPVALGNYGADSFLITEAIENCIKLSELRIDGAHNPKGGPHSANGVSNKSNAATNGDAIRRDVISRVARVARQMHGAGLHHQDFYLGHLLLPNQASSEEGVYVIDLGRVRKQQPLATRWVVKDLAQLNYSARHIRLTDRVRFLREYLGHKIGAVDKRLVSHILAKTSAIARHSQKNRL